MEMAGPTPESPDRGPGIAVEPGIEPTDPMHSLLWRLQGIFFEPTQTFREVKQRPGWPLPLLLLIVMGLFANFYVINTIGLENIIRQQFSQNARIQEMPAEQREALIEQQTTPPFSYVGYAAPLFLALGYVIIAALLLLVLVIVGSESSFSRVFSVVCYSFFAYGLIATVALILVLSITSDPETLNVRDAVQSHLGFLVDAKESPVLHTLASSFDILTFYGIYLISLGLSVVARRLSFGGALGGVLVLWVIYVGGKLGFAVLTS